MGTNKRYADRIDQRAAERVQWHPRGNAYPNRWICRNGQHGTFYGTIEAIPERRGGLPVTVYRATTTTGELLGEFSSGDTAAEVLWERFRTTFAPASKHEETPRAHPPK